jgi:hypothetical protein
VDAVSYDLGPLCACGCYRSEHRVEVDDDFHFVTRECLTCSECGGFEGDDTTPKRIEAEA